MKKLFLTGFILLNALTANSKDCFDKELVEIPWPDWFNFYCTHNSIDYCYGYFEIAGQTVKAEYGVSQVAGDESRLSIRYSRDVAIIKAAKENEKPADICFVFDPIIVTVVPKTGN